MLHLGQQSVCDSITLEVLVDLGFPVPQAGPRGECEDETQAESEQTDDHREAKRPWQLGHCPVAFVERQAGNLWIVPDRQIEGGDRFIVFPLPGQGGATTQ